MMSALFHVIDPLMRALLGVGHGIVHTSSHLVSFVAELLRGPFRAMTNMSGALFDAVAWSV